MRFFYVLLLIVALLEVSSHAATGTLRGVVKNGKSGKPIMGASVRINEKNVSTTTDADGAFQFTFTLSAVLPGDFSPLPLVSPRYIPGRGIVFANKRKGYIKAELFNLSGKRISLLNNSIMERGIRSIPLYDCAKGLYLCRIRSDDGKTAFRFVVNENGKRREHSGKSQALDNYALYKAAASAVAVDTIITDKPGYGTDTLLWNEKPDDSVTILLFDTASILSQASVRTILPFDRDWLFNKGDVSGAEQPAFSDASWRALNVPHDWSIEGPFDENAPTTGYGAYLPAGIGWYRKHFTLPAEFSGKRVFIEFDGVMANSTVYMNGASLGSRPFGYITFRYEITDKANAGTGNVVAVKVDNSAQPASRWYSGAGIYGHVRLIAMSPVHIGQWATFVTTPAVATDKATVHVQTTVVNQAAEAQNVTVQATVIDPNGNELSPAVSSAENVSGGGSADFGIDIPVANPELWSPETPDLYRVVTTLRAGTTPLDDEISTFGIRTITFDPETGFFLNGKNVKHKGVCLHHDISGLGAAVHTRAIQRRLAVLKKLGVNAIRTSHNPVVPQMLDLCDRMGFLVLDEFFDVWKTPKYNMPGDYSAAFSRWYKTDAADIVRRDRNHPSVVFYSIGNEIRDGLSVRKPITTELVKICHDNDPTRPVTQALFRPKDAGDYPDGTLNILDVFGVNYRTSELLEAVTGSMPHHAGVTTEIAPSTSEWSGFVIAHPQVVGEYLWTGADYLGESDGGWPRVGAASGLIDRVGTVKDIGYKYQTTWGGSGITRPQTSTKAAVKVLLSVDHAVITVAPDDVAYVKASIVDASGVTVSSANTDVTFTVSGSSGSIIAVDSGTPNGESFRGNSRKAYQGECFAIVQMHAAGSITVSASAKGLEGSSVTVTGTDGPFIPCSGDCD